MDERLSEILFDIQSDLPRQGPGNDESTRRALALCADLPNAPLVLDVGCGPGAQTLALAAALEGARIVALDFHRPYLEDLVGRASDAALVGTRVLALEGDMRALPLGEGSLDLIWAEGSAYSMGVDEALKAWRPLLRPGGYLAFSELVWLLDEPPAEAAAFFREEYPAMGGMAAVRALIEASGYRLIGDFVLPDAAWWQDYYTPLAERLGRLEAKYVGDEAALSLIEMARREQEMRRRFPEAFGYAFYVARKPRT